MARIFSTSRDRRNALLWVGAIVGSFLVALVLIRSYVPSLSNPESIRAFVLEFGVLAPLVFVLLQAAQVVVAPIPGQVLGFVAGYLFGAAWGTVYSVGGAVVGSYVAFRISRRYGRSYVERVVDADFLAQFDATTSDEGELALFLAFLIPGLPDDAICFVAGLTDMNIRRMVVISLVGRMPGYTLICLAGAGVASRQFVQTATILVTLAVLSAVGYLRREQLLGWIQRR